MKIVKNLKVLLCGATVLFAPGIGLSQAMAQVVAPSFLPELEIVEFRDNFKAGSVGNGVIFRVENTTAFPVFGLSLRPHLPAQYLTLDQIDPPSLDLEPGDIAKITAGFSVREDAEIGAEDVIDFHFEVEAGPSLPIPSYRLIATIEEGEEQEPEAQCNSAVESGGDAGGGVTVDLGGFVGLAGFSWEMFDIKDQMNITVGGVQKTTGCVSGTGTIEINIPPGAGSAVVEVVPNCEQTTGTAWEFTFECPLSSDITADGSGNALASADADNASSLVAPAPTAVGAPVAPARPAPAWQGPTGHSIPESESNNSQSNATPLVVGDMVSATIEPRGDADYYTVTLQHQGELSVAFPSAPHELNMAFRVIGEHGHQIRSWQTAPAGGAAYAAWADIKTPGIYTIEVRDGSNDAASQSPYQMVATFTPTADMAEPNDTIAQATPLGWNQAMLSNILPKGEPDYYAVTAAQQGQLTVNFTASPDELNMAFRVLSSNGHQVHSWQSATTAGQAFQAWADLDAPGVYYIEVRDGSNDARSSTPYEIVASLNPTQDQGEPNNSVASASPAPFDTPVLASIMPQGDADYYQIDVPHQGELTVAFTHAPAALNMAFRVLGENGHQIRSWQTAPVAGQPFSGWADLQSPGRYIVEVRDGSNDARAADPYRMVLAFAPTADPAEPNGRVEDASALGFGIVMQAAILPKGDSDYYRITADHQGELQVDFTQVPAALNMAFRVLGENGHQIRSWQTAPQPGEDFSGWADLQTPGGYIIQVNDGANDARTAAPYTLVATLARTSDTSEPNGSVAQATPIALGEVISASILPQGEADYYRITAPGAGELRVAFTQSPPNLNMAFRVLGASGHQVRSWQSSPTVGTPFTGFAALTDAGVYVIEIRDGANDARSSDAYKFEVTLGE